MNITQDSQKNEDTQQPLDKSVIQICKTHKRQIEFICTYPSCSKSNQIEITLCSKCTLQSIHRTHLGYITAYESQISTTPSIQTRSDISKSINEMNRLIERKLAALDLFKEQEIAKISNQLNDLELNAISNPQDFLISMISGPVTRSIESFSHIDSEFERRNRLFEIEAKAESILIAKAQREFDLNRLVGYVHQELNLFNDVTLIEQQVQLARTITLLKRTSASTFVFLADNLLVCFDFVAREVISTLLFNENAPIEMIECVASGTIIASQRRKLPLQDLHANLQLNHPASEIVLISHSKAVLNLSNQQQQRRNNNKAGTMQRKLLYRLQENQKVVDLKRIPKSPSCVAVLICEFHVDSSEEISTVLILHFQSGKIIKRIILKDKPNSLNFLFSYDIYSVFRTKLVHEISQYQTVCAAAAAAAAAAADASQGQRYFFAVNASQGYVVYDMVGNEQVFCASQNNIGSNWFDYDEVIAVPALDAVLRIGESRNWIQSNSTGEKKIVPWNSSFENVSTFSLGRYLPFVEKCTLLFCDLQTMSVVKSCRLPERISGSSARNNPRIISAPLMPVELNSDRMRSERVNVENTLQFETAAEHDNHNPRHSENNIQLGERTQFQLQYRRQEIPDALTQIEFNYNLNSSIIDRFPLDNRITMRPIAILNSYSAIVVIYANGTVLFIK